MSATIFEHKAQLVQPLLQTSGGAAGQGIVPATTTEDHASQQPTGLGLLQSSSSSLDSSRRTLNQAQSGAGVSRELDLEVGVELSPPPESIPGRRSMSYEDDGQDSLEKEEGEEGEEDNDLLLGDNFAAKLINHSGVYRILPKPYNPG